MKKPFYQDDIVKLCTDDHLTAEEIFFLLKKKHSSIWKATVYRNLEELVKQWFLNKLIWIDSKARFEKNKGFHAHLYDEKTWKIYDIDLDLEKLKLSLPENFKINEIELLVKWEKT